MPRQQTAISEPNRLGVIFDGAQEFREVSGKVLPVGVHGDHMREAVDTRIMEAGKERFPFAAIFAEIYDHGFRVTPQDLGSGICAAVVDDEHSVARSVKERPIEDFRERPGVIVRRQDDEWLRSGFFHVRKHLLESL